MKAEVKEEAFGKILTNIQCLQPQHDQTCDWLNVVKQSIGMVSKLFCFITSIIRTCF